MVEGAEQKKEVCCEWEGGGVLEGRPVRARSSGDNVRVGARAALTVKALPQAIGRHAIQGMITIREAIVTVSIDGTLLDERSVLGEQTPVRIIGPALHRCLVDLLHGDELGSEVAVGLEDVVEDALCGVSAHSMNKVEVAVQGRWRGRRRG